MSVDSGDRQYQFQVSIGRIVVTWNGAGLITRIDWFAGEPESRADVSVPAPVARLIERLREYFACGQPLGELPWNQFDQEGWTPFQRQVYRTIAQIPHGETRTYGWVASRVRKAFATRAVGQALRNNPLPIVIPCHRVVAANSLGGFMGALDPNEPELQLKRSLLALEQEFLSPPFPFMAADAAGARALDGALERRVFAEDTAGQLDFFLPVAPFGIHPSAGARPSAGLA